MSAPRVVVLGDANVDLVLRLPDRARQGRLAHTPDPELFGGGTAANTSTAIARLGLPVAFIGMIGDDLYGREVRADLSAYHVDLRGLRVREDVVTPMVIAVVQSDGDRSVVVWPPRGGAHTRLRPEDVDAGLIEGAAWLHATGMCLDQQPSAGALLHGMRLARAAGVPVSLDLNLRLELGGWRPDQRATVEQAIALSDVVLGSAEEEFLPLTETESVEAAARAVAAGQRTAIARMGESGAYVVWPEGEAHVAGFHVAVADTLGAGDIFNAGFIAARLDGCTMPEAVRRGNAVAALSIAKHGARGAPTPDELDAFLARV